MRGKVAKQLRKEAKKRGYVDRQTYTLKTKQRVNGKRTTRGFYLQLKREYKKT